MVVHPFQPSQEMLTDIHESEKISIPAPTNDLTQYEFIVVLTEFCELQQFYNDMETIGGSLYIPNREVSVLHRRPSSRSTHYLLTYAEAETLRADPRVYSVELSALDQGLTIAPLSSQYSANWSKSSTADSSQKNWGLYRCYTGHAVQNWGNDGTGDVSGTVNILSGGKHVDVVIIDGHIDPTHPEYAVNADGTGGSRVVQYNWFQHNPEVTGQPASTYDYSFLAGAESNNNHGAHVAGIACGNTNGWARSANIYNISPYGNGNATTLVDPIWMYKVFDYVRAFHKHKPINPATGRKNPTVCNMSFGLTGKMPITSIVSVQFRYSLYSVPDWNPYRGYLGLMAADASNNMLWHARDSSLDADIADGISDGIVFVGAAGNFFMYNATPDDINYDNALIKADHSYSYYMRGPSPTAAPGVIHVSSVDSTVEERKADYSNAGSRTDIFAPGTTIMSAARSASSSTNDPRNSAYKIMKLSGTSMATPQVSGVVACILSTYPEMNCAQVLSYLKSSYCVTNQLTDVVDNYMYPFIYTNSLLGAPNRYLKFVNERAEIGVVTPKKNHYARPGIGVSYPRAKIKRRG